jgi:hypothetical protein
MMGRPIFGCVIEKTSLKKIRFLMCNVVCGGYVTESRVFKIFTAKDAKEGKGFYFQEAFRFLCRISSSLPKKSFFALPLRPLRPLR